MSAHLEGSGNDQVHPRHMWIITGPAGCGKSSVATYLAAELSLPFLEGDDVSLSSIERFTQLTPRQFHSPANKAKMTQGVPLTDSDRWDWLIQLREAAANCLSSTTASATKSPTGVIVTCSALKRKYRDVIRVAAYNDHRIAVHFIYLRADEAVLMARVGARVGHYMKSTMVHSQMELLEEPDQQEQGRDVLEVDCQASLPEVQITVVGIVQQILASNR